ncbi:glycosyl transferase [Hyphomonas sp.]|uniref:glycosyl transferase n=1 Tax=Hyphomonas sp. TaxID=87 RepID=UPI00391B57E0
MTRIAFFGHDAADAAVRRRVKGFIGDGLDVTGFMMRRRDPGELDWDNIDLGETRDGAFVQRIRQVFTGARIAAANKHKLAACDLIYARNLDMLACAFLAKRYAKLDTPVIYESLDVHRLLTRSDVIGAGMRWIEHALLKRTVGLVVSSPGFIRNHFEKHYPGDYRAFLVENRLTPDTDYGSRVCVRKSVAASPGRPLRLGWVGILRCQRSLNLLCALADQFPDQLEIRLHGLPARSEIAEFEPVIEARPNMTYFGRYRAPEDLSAIYDELDVVWAGDFMEAGYNSVWLLPNRIYEGGYYCTPSIAPAGTETAAWVARHACGFIIDEPLDETLPELIRTLIADRESIAGYAGALSKLPEDTFIQPRGYLAGIVSEALSLGKRKAA